MPRLDTLPFDNTFARLPGHFHTRLAPVPFNAGHQLVSFNPDAAALLGLDPAEAQRPDFVAMLCGEKPLPGAEPLAMNYAGHQFGVYVPQLGDGRALLLGEVRNAQGEKWDIQLKGSGPTPYSRGGDGRAVLRSTLREYLCGEAMHGLGIPTTRALCVIGTNAPVYREQVEPGAMLVRLSPSHVRFGTFERFFYREQPDAVHTLADYVITHHHPELADKKDRHVLWLREVVLATARLIAKWQAVGFAHGVMNTDNMSILGLTLDYGPFGFLDTYDPGFICNHSDHQGRYAFERQPQIGLWNLTCLAQALSPLMPVEAAREQLELYESAYATHYIELMCAKLGLFEPGPQAVPLIRELLALLAQQHVDYTRFFRALSHFDTQGPVTGQAARDLFIDRAAFDAWAQDYRDYLLGEGNSDDAARQARMRRTNPKFILRNYLAQQAIEQAYAGDYSETERLLEILRTPFDEHPQAKAWAGEPPDWAAHIAVSCSS